MRRRNRGGTDILRNTPLGNCAIATLWCVLCAVAWADEARDCVELSPYDAAELAHYPFDAAREDDTWKQLDRDRVYTANDVRIVVQPIFDPADPAENNAVYRWADRLHADTRPATIRAALAFRSGGPVTVSALRESERILRTKPYLFDARVIPRRVCGTRLDVDVVARDVWTLLPDADFQRSGGENTYAYGLTDANLLGRGHTLSLFYEKDPDREGHGIYYLDPNVGGSRFVVETLYEDNSDGSRRLVDVRTPFYALDARAAFGVHAERDNQERGLYALGDKFAQFAQTARTFSLDGGVSRGERNAQVWRWLAGYTYDDHTFAPAPGHAPPNPLPADRTVAYPWFGFESIEDRFDTSSDIDRIHRTEDIDLGRRYSMALGYSTSAFGGDDQDRLVLRGEYRDATRHGEHLVFYGTRLRGYWNFTTNRSEEVIAKAFAAYRQENAGRFSLAAAADATAVHNLPTDMQLLGGGDTGLRGYPSRYQWGNRSWTASVEERYITDVYFARIVRLGIAAFFDAGRTWFSGGAGGDGTLADVGFGFRFTSTRTRQDRVLHIDFAFPLVDGPDVQSMQVLFVVKDRL